jgi:competence protein ComGC
MGKLSILGEMWQFIRHKKRYWLLPIIVILMLVAILLLVTQGTAVAPFIYTLF